MTAPGPNPTPPFHCADPDKNCNNQKSPNLEQFITSTRTNHNQSFNVLACFVLEFLGFIFYIHEKMHEKQHFRKNAQR